MKVALVGVLVILVGIATYQVLSKFISEKLNNIFDEWKF